MEDTDDEDENNEGADNYLQLPQGREGKDVFFATLERN